MLDVCGINVQNDGYWDCSRPDGEPGQLKTLCKREGPGASKVLQVSEDSERLLPCLCQSGGLDRQSNAPHQNPFVGPRHALCPRLDHGTAPEGYLPLHGIYITKFEPHV